MREEFDSYLSLEEFNHEVDSSSLYKVKEDGSITVKGRRYYDKQLFNYVGEYIHAFVDNTIDEADAPCFTAFDKTYICVAKNPELWSLYLNQ